MAALHDLSADALVNAYRRRQLSPVEVARAVLERIEAWEPKIHAMYVVDTVGALAQASNSERRWREGEPLSAIDGVPITIKDNIALKGVPTPVGTAAGDLTPAAADAPPTARVREAGCVIVGKTTMPDYGMLASGVSSFHGTTRNPWNLSRNPAGSSSGAGAGIAAGYGPLALGTDIGGSVRLPAAYNGIFALKPSLGRVPIYPPYLGRTTGPMTRTVRDAALLLTELAKPDARDFMALPYEARDWAGLLSSDLKGKRFGLVLDIGAGLPVQPAVKAAVEQAAEAFAAAGAEIEPVDPFITPEMYAGLERFFQTRSLAELDQLDDKRRAKVLPFLREWCALAQKTSGVDLVRALGQIMLVREKAAAAVERFDFLLGPTSPITAYAADEPAPGADPRHAIEHWSFTAPFNMSEQPAASICAGYGRDGLPIGLQIIGHRFDDLGVLRMAWAYEQLRQPLRDWPEP
jgi:aspartyl-tRNA(Asn)/glutamyl-tRNA(Gln) amidotransferase subunit A